MAAEKSIYQKRAELRAAKQAAKAGAAKPKRSTPKARTKAK